MVRRNIELNDDALGFVAAMELNPQKARILLRMGLTKTKDVGKIQSYFNEY
jgi:L-asparaginase